MRHPYVIGAAISLVLVTQAGPAQAHPRHDAGAVAFVSDRDSTSSTPTDEIYLLDPQTREVHRITDDLDGVERWPTISPDGRTLAWVRIVPDDAGAARPDLTEIYRCDLRTRSHRWTCDHPREVTGPVRDAVIAWTPDSRRLLFSGPLNTDLDSDIYAVDLRTGRTTNLTNEAVVDGRTTQNGQPTVAPNGRHFVYSQGGGPTGADLYRRHIDGRHPVQLTAAALNDNAPEYSPDGRRLVFHSNRDGDSDIYVMKASVEEPANPAVDLTDELRSSDGETSSQERTPSFSPDGRRIAFWWFTDPAAGPDAGFNDGDIYVMRVDGSGVRNLTEPDPAALRSGDIQPDWGPRPARPRS